MTQVATTLMTMAAMLVHALLGCCAHHEHAAHDHGPAEHACAADEHRADAASDHCRHEHGPASDDEHAPAKPCDSPRCQLLTAQGTAKLMLLWQWSLDAVAQGAPVDLGHDGCDCTVLNVAAAAPPPILLCAKLRAHARLRLWQV